MRRFTTAVLLASALSCAAAPPLPGAPPRPAPLVNVTSVNSHHMTETFKEDNNKPAVPPARKQYKVSSSGQVEVGRVAPGETVTWELRVRFERKPRVGGQYRPLPPYEYRIPGTGSEDWWIEDYVLVKPYGLAPIGTDTDILIFVEGTYKISGPNGDRGGTIPKVTATYHLAYN